jgi:hypothetical protein
MAIAISALPRLAGMSDNRPRQGADCTANNSALHRVAGYCCADRGSAQAADCRALFGARACAEREKQAQYEHCLLHGSLLRLLLAQYFVAPSFRSHR